MHNHGTYENSVAKGCNAPSWREKNENKTIGAYMSAAGYTTGFFGMLTASNSNNTLSYSRPKGSQINALSYGPSKKDNLCI